METTIEGAKHILINFSGDMNLGLMETEEAAELIREAIDPEAEIIFGTTLNEELNDEVVVTVIATGLEDEAHTEAPARRSFAVLFDLEYGDAFVRPIRKWACRHAKRLRFCPSGR